VHQRDAQIVTDIPPPMDAAGHSDASHRALVKADFPFTCWTGGRAENSGRKETTYFVNSTRWLRTKN